jgi:hypothetical protein
MSPGQIRHRVPSLSSTIPAASCRLIRIRSQCLLPSNSVRVILHLVNRAALSSSIAIAGDLLGHPLQGFASITLEDPVRRNIAQATDYRHEVRWVAALFTVGYGVGGFTFQIVGHGYFPDSARTSTCSSSSTTSNPWPLERYLTQDCIRGIVPHESGGVFGGRSCPMPKELHLVKAIISDVDRDGTARINCATRHMEDKSSFT